MLKHVALQTADGLQLPGLFFEPEKPSTKAVIYLHGNGSSSVFYDVEENQIMAKALHKAGIAYLPFNNRGALLTHSVWQRSTSYKKRIQIGTSHELIADCLIDIDAAVTYLQTAGYQEIFLMGHSTGANKAVYYYAHQAQSVIKGYILLGGGDDSGSYFREWGRPKFERLLTQSREQVKSGRGNRLVPTHLVGEGQIISWQSLLDTIDPDGNYNLFPFTDALQQLKLTKRPLFAEFAASHAPVLVVYGEYDEYCYGAVKEAVALLKKAVHQKPNYQFVIIPNSDHGFHGKEQELAELCTHWIDQQ